MIESYKLLNKCDRFMLTYNKNKIDTFYKIDLTLKHRFWTDELLLQEYDQYFESTNGSKIGRGWQYSVKADAEAAYTWAVLKWNTHE